jgi:hypothetical protein
MSHSSTSLGHMRVVCCALLSMFLSAPIIAGASDTAPLLKNDRVALTVTIRDGAIVSDRLTLLGGSAKGVETDGDFGLDVQYTDWRAPGRANNADNPVLLTKNDFTVTGSSTAALPGGAQELTVVLKGKETPFDLRISYRLEQGAFYARKRLVLSDTAFGHHFLRWFWPVRANVSGVTAVVHPGGFGQPVAVRTGAGGAFFGLEYPASENRIAPPAKGRYLLTCGEEFGSLIGKTGLESEWVVIGATPDAHLKLWFFTYLDAIRVAPLRPYTLYNSWYDLRSPEYPKVPPENVMSEASAMKMVSLLRENMIEKHGIALDAFVLDDGWDIYRSDWVLRPEQFPNGLRPLADELKKTNTSLGVWFGPTGGYSFRTRRIEWMKEHGYEVVGDQLCVAGAKYGPLLTKRVTDFAKNDNVGYYKWDGIQFSCSEPDHGHPVDVYSRRAVMESVIRMCASARGANPAMFLNITSGTWLSPWWLKYANTIWMDGADYGYADVPSISQRDAASTYRDFVLYEDFTLKGLWFPVANLMTHGIIKGKLELLGSPEEPLDKFTDDALLYFARGVSMYELYISPDILSEGEWNTLAAGISWAKDRFPVLSSTFMIGGNPMKRETYGYAHFKGSKGVIAARNPFITGSSLAVTLDPALGLDPSAKSLVLERVYPTRWISPRVYAAGDRVQIPLDGYETAVYEVYPLADAVLPLLAGVQFTVSQLDRNRYTILYHDEEKGAVVLNPAKARKMVVNSIMADPESFTLTLPKSTPVVAGTKVTRAKSGGIAIDLTVGENASNATVALLLTPQDGVKGDVHPEITVSVDGEPARVRSEQQEGRSQWYTVEVAPGAHSVIAGLAPGGKPWKGSVSAWFVARERRPMGTVMYVLAGNPKERPMPPHPWGPGEVRRTVKLGEGTLETGTAK